MWMKASFVAAAATLPQPALAADWVTWLDLGCHGPMCSPALRGQCVDPAPWAAPELVRVAQTEPVDDALGALSPRAFVRAHRVTFAGTVFGVGRAHAARAMAAFSSMAASLVGRGVADTDQTVFHFLFAAQVAGAPPVLAPYHVFMQDWHRVVTGYTGAD